MMTTRKRLILVLVIFVWCIGCDQITKEIAKAHLPKTKTLSFAGGALRLDYTENRGAVFSFEYCLPERWRGSTLTAAVALFLVLLLLYLLFASRPKPVTVIALSLICGGSLSNLLDRIVLGGVVIDFLSLGWDGIRTAIFNVADAAITLGAMLLALRFLWNLGRLTFSRPSQPAG